jgi:hypothetical protein
MAEPAFPVDSAVEKPLTLLTLMLVAPTLAAAARVADAGNSWVALDVATLAPLEWA